MPPTWDESAGRTTRGVPDGRRTRSDDPANGDRRRSMPGSAEPLWTVAEVATYLQVSRSWVYHQSECGLLPSLRIGGLLRFSPAAVRAYALATGHGSR